MPHKKEHIPSDEEILRSVKKGEEPELPPAFRPQQDAPSPFRKVEREEQPSEPDQPADRQDAPRIDVRDSDVPEDERELLQRILLQVEEMTDLIRTMSGQ